MKCLEIKIVERTECESKIGEYNQSDFHLHSSFICAGGESGKDTCKVGFVILIEYLINWINWMRFFKGDGGSPLVCKQPGDMYYKIAGLVVKGIGCGQPVPALYANIPHMVEWITTEIRQAEIFQFFT